MAYRVMLVERDRLMLEQLSQTIRKTAGFELVARYQNPSEALGQGSVFQPNLILLDVEGTTGSNLLTEFHSTYDGVAILCMGEQWQAERASHYVQAGAKGYIVKPFTSEELKEAVDTFARSGMEVGAETITFFSPKGKSGKTTLIANLAMELARRSRAKVGIIDADLQFGDMAVFFSLSPTSTIVEAARDLGANAWTATCRVLLPLLAPGIAAGALLAFTLSIDDFVITFFVAGPGATTLPIRIYSMIKHGSPPLINALSSILLVVTFVTVTVSQHLTREKA